METIEEKARRIAKERYAAGYEAGRMSQAKERETYMDMIDYLTARCPAPMPKQSDTDAKIAVWFLTEPNGERKPSVSELNGVAFGGTSVVKAIAAHVRPHLPA